MRVADESQRPEAHENACDHPAQPTDRHNRADEERRRHRGGDGQRVSHIDVRPLLSQVKTPTLVVHCDRDHAVAPERGRQLAAEIPGARYVSLPSTNHLMLEEEPAWPLFLSELGLFLHW